MKLHNIIKNLFKSALNIQFDPGTVRSDQDILPQTIECVGSVVKSVHMRVSKYSG